MLYHTLSSKFLPKHVRMSDNYTSVCSCGSNSNSQCQTLCKPRWSPDGVIDALMRIDRVDRSHRRMQLQRSKLLMVSQMLSQHMHSACQPRNLG